MPYLAVLLLLAACSSMLLSDEPGRHPAARAGALENARITEASGLARANRTDGVLWTINDGGSTPTLFALGEDGGDRGAVRLDGATNVDWEDLASFAADGTPWLLVADIGDNAASRDFVSLYFVVEPALQQDQAAVARRVSFTYPDGPRDAEAVAVDADRGQVLVMSKRTLPPVVYAVPLDAADGATVQATRLGAVPGLPAPGRADLARAPLADDWHWQPTGMDLAPDGRAIAVLTYRAVYLFVRGTGASFIEALQETPTAFPLGGLREAEAVAFGPSGQEIFVTAERRHAPLYRFDLPP